MDVALERLLRDEITYLQDRLRIAEAWLIAADAMDTAINKALPKMKREQQLRAEFRKLVNG